MPPQVLHALLRMTQVQTACASAGVHRPQPVLGCGIRPAKQQKDHPPHDWSTALTYVHGGPSQIPTSFFTKPFPS
eukprot:CAMPEP_0175442478 /NCGR_PEP_ID=MMETSP0095-20121207/58167_1 /TAXON_ID=311494 /ORGANISM="Alexandrium monilatum, Strain CCMP3105" /LENGTH=74 /DNA_ID=CAMNT_0016742505 /DNA_START=18 /DNA_END=242 /DNA_ORIENTATION=+